MKIAVRSLVLVLAFAGAVASAKTPVAPSKATGKKPVPMVRIPMCPPDDPDACGLGK